MRNNPIRLALPPIGAALSLSGGHADTKSMAALESMGLPLFARGQGGCHNDGQTWPASLEAAEAAPQHPVNKVPENTP